jgi:hypothetical protein
VASAVGPAASSARYAATTSPDRIPPAGAASASSLPRSPC